MAQSPNILFVMSDDHADWPTTMSTDIGCTDEMEWELFDLKADPLETNNIWGQTDVSEIQSELLAELARLQEQVGDQPFRSQP